ncbi:hypothetical protein L204_102345 [Cryptococcus depauperatus]
MAQLNTLLQAQLSTLQIIVSMYPLSSELFLSPATSSFYQATIEDAQEDIDVGGLDVLEGELRIAVEDGKDESVEVYIGLPTLSAQPGVEEGIVILKPKQPTWLPNTAYANLLSSIFPHSPQETDPSEYILTTLESIRRSLSTFLSSSSSLQGKARQGQNEEKDQGVLERVWFWLPTLSTREKRDDLVSYANDMGLTGFVLAGKPALLCMEGPGKVVDRYMAKIKGESWSDIPSYQKKVTERLRRPLGPSPASRAFTSMSEITQLIPRYGQYNHRGEMGEVRRLMDEWGVGEDFAAVVLNNA